MTGVFLVLLKLLQTCATLENYEKYNIIQSGCITAEILGKANDVSFSNIKHSGNRKGCRCMESRNIGDYDTCPNGCKYCYANQNPQIARKNYEKHNADSPLILGGLNPTDEISQGSQRSFLIKHKQQKLF